jgi:uncharacterized membrane protein
VDAARGVAIAMMALYHLVYDLDVFGGYRIESTSGFWALFADLTATSFLLLVGVSLSISYRRSGGAERGLFGKYAVRGLRIFAYGMVITLVFRVFGLGTVAFGILHLIGVSIVLAYPLLRFRLLSALLGLLVIAAGFYLRAHGFPSGSPWLLPFGVAPEGLFMPDYRPLLPWFGVVLLGVSAGSSLYGGRKPVVGGAGSPAGRSLASLGRHSLLIYLLHQPVLIAVLAALGVIDLG